jgi:hypothetical protein
MGSPWPKTTIYQLARNTHHLRLSNIIFHPFSINIESAKGLKLVSADRTSNTVVSSTDQKHLIQHTTNPEIPD